MEDIRELFKIYHIESPSKTDLEAGRSESEGIVGSLKLASIKFKTFSPCSKVDLNSVIEEIIQDVLPLRGDLGSITLHFSMHGNIDGMQFTSGETISWQEMVSVLNKLISGIGRIPDESGLLKQDIAPIFLVFSSCFGAYASKINDLTSDQLFMGLVGPKKEIPWEDAQIGYLLLYYNTIIKEKGYLETVALMNHVIGEDIFLLYPGHGFAAF